MPHKLDLELLRAAFERTFNAEPRAFGSRSSSIQGFSDNAKGVQWNVGLIAESGSVKLGVNLEGMSYGNTWPIRNFILTELQQMALYNQFGQYREVTLRFDRDAWQVTARPPIEEKLICHGKLSEVSKDVWVAALEEGLGCLNQSKSYKGRDTQIVTLIPSGKKAERQVSPHIGFKIKITPQNRSLDSLCKAMAIGRRKLHPIYDHMIRVTG
ncbi:hypothetical protein BCV02_01325 [Vibrio breoganii]|uniref:DUF3156 family protein n=1 Tax=Vibrio breoganii TaxID=553239 RepID=A0ABX1U9H2_9VIBR|nr:hypothetical protein [Vibrio breoganii]NMO74435.1 hypothetical protein [Vibrio breoganii]NMR70390.1 hypothetical protein [Vibrio breoganii]PMG03951.1 hypothetical protein BCV02_01325 [Vibrio breoganii]PML86135.1 hypothetical protein BCT67_01545 [Vibrio breoganii]